jgi:recombination protein RecA
MTEFSGDLTSGATSVALKTMATAQAARQQVVYIDPPGTFDPHYALRCGVNLSRLVLVHPRDEREALAILDDIIAGEGAALVVLNATRRFLARLNDSAFIEAALRRLRRTLARTLCVSLFLTPVLPGTSPVSSPTEILLAQASVRVHFRRQQWLKRRGEIVGYRVEAALLRYRWGQAGQQVSFPVYL